MQLQLIPMGKACSTCKEIRPLSEFYRRKASPDGLAYVCKACERRHFDQLTLKDPEAARERGRANAARWRERNPERSREIQRAYGERHPTKRAEYARRWRERNQNKLPALRVKWEPREVSAARARQRRKDNPERSRMLSRKHSRTRQGRVQYAGAAVEYMEILRRDPCSYCGGLADTADHIEPSVNGGANTWDNLTAACRSCNARKHAMPLLIFMLRKVTVG